MKAWKTLALAAVLGTVGAGMLAAQRPAPAEPTISVDRAQAIALARVPHNQGVRSAKLEREDGVLVYTVEVETPGPGHQQVRVNALNGSVVSDRHQDDVVSTAANKVTGATHDVGHAVTHAAKETGKAVSGAAKETGKAVSRAASATGKTVDRVLTGDEVKNAHPRISESRARAIAMRRFPSAKNVKDSDLKMENGMLVWEVSVDTPREGHEEVTINANTGHILRTHHEVGIAGKTKQEVEKVVH
jgi:uncharacterized membrane protein YkoI